MESLSKSLYEYGELLKVTDLQKAYKSLMQYIKELRRYFKEKYPEYEVSANLYLGYLDLTFFTITSKLAQQNQLKYMVVFRHDKMQFEVWLSGRNRAVMSKYHRKFSGHRMNKHSLTADDKGMSSIIETIVVEKPDFDNMTELTNQIDLGVISFIQEVENTFLTDE
ncbi:DUF7000 family protein [Metaplanococcus flavidus]|uniref:DUF7000 family protein n=1 Tax=Metaplanococcus flavidus TaxID=569883 RepID=A0ABW3LA21_9BACL